MPISNTRAAKVRAKVLLAGKASVIGIGLNRVGSGFGVKVNLSEPPPLGLDQLLRNVRLVRENENGPNAALAECPAQVAQGRGEDPVVEPITRDAKRAMDHVGGHSSPEPGAGDFR
jgi:hypothetical protein